MLTKSQFEDELFMMRHDYIKENSWVEAWRHWKSEPIMKSYITAAYNMYNATASNALKLTVLGDTEIRSMEPLIRNFGLMSAQGVQEAKDEAMVKDLEKHRQEVAAGAHDGPKGATKVLGVGSILSDKKWTPILNDALMLGSIEGNQTFYLGLNSSEQAAWAKYGFNSNVAGKAAMFGGAIENKRNQWEKNWHTFFRKQPQMIWSGSFPRVFARELLALKFFGYKPVYSKMGLAFAPKRGTSIGPPGFQTYTRELRKIGFFNNNKQQVMGHISKFLFNDDKALL